MCTVYFSMVDKITEYALNKQLELLPEHLKNRLNNITDNKNRTCSLVGTMIASALLKDKKAGIDIHCLSYNDNGKPLLPNGHTISVAHSGNVVLCGYSADGALGVDVETLQGTISPYYEDYLTSQEKTAVNAAHDINLAFKQIWVRKEAVLKADGIGLLYPLNELEVTAPTVTLHPNTYHLYNMAIAKGYVAAIATTTSSTNIILQEVLF